jgi:glucosamine--fructose-6-phosphate aminotransferase (isomerizing)
MSPTLIAGPYLADLLAQPECFGAVCRSLAETPAPTALAHDLQRGRYRRVVLTGMGSSLHALYPLHLQLIERGFTSHWVETSELLLGYHPFRASDTLLVVVSQSGQSAEVVNLVKLAGSFGHVLAVTNAPGSPLAREAGTVLPLHAGTESTVSCKTYLNTLAVLHWLGQALTSPTPAHAVEELTPLEPLLRRYLDETDEHVAALAPWVAEVRSIFVTGRGVSLATAGTGGLILKESTRQHAEGMSAAAFRHGPLEMIGEHVLVLILEGCRSVAGLHRRLADDIRQGGGRAALIATERASAAVFHLPAVPLPLLPFVEILPIQMLSLAIAARDGREAGRFERATKITTAE